MYLNSRVGMKKSFEYYQVDFGMPPMNTLLALQSPNRQHQCKSLAYQHSKGAQWGSLISIFLYNSPIHQARRKDCKSNLLNNVMDNNGNILCPEILSLLVTIYLGKRSLPLITQRILSVPIAVVSATSVLKQNKPSSSD